MLLYHGSCVTVSAPRLLSVQRQLDFGKGFYTTSDYEQAAKWAQRRALRTHSAQAFVTVYALDETMLDELQVLKFSTPNQDWLRFVAANRKGMMAEAEWDIIIGPVANDKTMPVIDLYIDGMYDEDEAIRRLLPQKLRDQVVFKSDRALQLLSYVEVKTI